MSPLLRAHRQLLERRRGSMNLVGPGPLEPHYEDSAAGLAGLVPTGHWADLGTGAGFPGIVLASLSQDLAVDLVDSRQKRCTFLEAALLEGGPRPGPVRVICGRVEDLPTGAYDGVTSRAFAAPAEYLAHAHRLLKPGGIAVVFVQGDVEVAAPGFSHLRTLDYIVEGKTRRAVHLTKIAE